MAKIKQEADGDEEKISLEEAVEKEPTFFSSHRKDREPRERPKRKEVDLGELEKAVKEALDEKSK